MEGAIAAPFLFTMAKKTLIQEEENVQEKKFEFKRIFEFVVFSFLLAFVIAPGLFYTDVMAHEFYHYLQHQDVTEEICIDVNKPYWGHVRINFENSEELLQYNAEQLNDEERKANIFGRIVSIMYLINALVVVHWILLLMIRRQKEKWD